MLVALSVSAAVVLPSSATAAPGDCDPHKGKNDAPTSVARHSDSDGSSEKTEFFAGGLYKVTRCDEKGKLAIEQLVRPIDVSGHHRILAPLVTTKPESDGTFRTEENFYRDPVADRARFAAESGDTGALPATDAPAQNTGNTSRAGGPLDGDVTAQSQPPECGNSTWRAFSNLGNNRWPSRTYTWYVNASDNMGDSWISAINQGHEAWDNTANDCGFGDGANIDAVYGGQTSSGAAFSPSNGRNGVDRGEVCDVMSSSICDQVLATTTLRWDGSGQVLETDQRYDTCGCWSFGAAPGMYDLQSVATHESGHSFGLDEAVGTSSSSDPDSLKRLTMYPSSFTNTTQARYLGWGDLRGMRCLYPSSSTACPGL